MLMKPILFASRNPGYQSISDTAMSLPNFTLFRNDRVSSVGGGVTPRPVTL